MSQAGAKLQPLVVADASASIGREIELPLANGYTAALARDGGGARLSLRSASSPPLEIIVEMTERGPVVRVHAAAIELESEGEIAARCERFTVDARESIEFVTQGLVRTEGRKVEIEATLGGVQVVANDAVQLLGEQVLLNCEPPRPMPGWAKPSLMLSPTLPPADVSGDLDPATLGEPTTAFNQDERE